MSFAGVRRSSMRAPASRSDVGMRMAGNGQGEAGQVGSCGAWRSMAKQAKLGRERWRVASRGKERQANVMVTRSKRETFEVNRQYKWRAGFAVHNMKRLDVQVVGEEIDRLMQEKRHRLKAEDVVEAAAIPTSPLHEAFEWDDTEAGRRWREEQARQLLRSYTIKIVQEHRPDVVIRANMSIEDESNPRQSTYGGTTELLGDEEMRALLLKQAIQKLLAVKRAYGQLQELAQVFAVVDKIAKRVG